MKSILQLILEFIFEGHKLTAILYGDTPLFLYEEVAPAMGYSLKQFQNRISDLKAAGVLDDVEHLRTFQGEELRLLDSAFRLNRNAKSRSQTLLTSWGLLLFAQGSRKPKAQAFFKALVEWLPKAEAKLQELKELKAAEEAAPAPEHLPSASPMGMSIEQMLAEAKFNNSIVRRNDQLAKGKREEAALCEDPDEAHNLKLQAARILGGGLVPATAPSLQPPPKGYWSSRTCAKWANRHYQLVDPDKPLTYRRWGNIAGDGVSVRGKHRLQGLNLLADRSERFWVKRKVRREDGSLEEVTFYSPEARQLIAGAFVGHWFTGKKGQAQLRLMDGGVE